MSQTHFMQQEMGFVQIFGYKIDDFSGSGRFTFSLAEDATRVERVFMRLGGICRILLGASIWHTNLITVCDKGSLQT